MRGMRWLSMVLALMALEALPATASAARAPVPTLTALLAHDAAGNTVAVWTDPSGALVTSHRRGLRAWTHHVTLYAPSRICWFRRARCVEDHVSHSIS